MDKPKLTDALADFQKRSATACLESWQGYWKFLGDIARDPSSVPAAYSKLAGIQLKSYQTALEASVALTENLFGKPPAAPPPSPSEVRELLFEGQAGETASRQFVMSNRTGQPFDVHFEVSEFATAAMEKTRVEVEVLPAEFSLQPGEEKTVECRVPLIDAFVEDCDYRAVLRAPGLPEMQVVLTARRVKAASSQ